MGPGQRVGLALAAAVDLLPADIQSRSLALPAVALRPRVAFRIGVGVAGVVGIGAPPLLVGLALVALPAGAEQFGSS